MFSGTNQDYLNLIDTKYFIVCQDQHVLEIGPFNGTQTKLIISHRPKYLEVIEPHHAVAPTDLQAINGIDNIIGDDVLLALSSPHLCDVVVCFGVLYHLHSPLHLLELIANHCRPTYLLLDSIGQFADEVNTSHTVFGPEPVNEPGTRQVRSEFKFSGFNVVCPGSIVQTAMDRLGYEVVMSDNLAITDNFSKSNSWVALWKIKETQ